MGKDEFKEIRKESRKIEDYRKEHPSWNLLVETDPERPGYGWIIHRGRERIQNNYMELPRYEREIQIKCRNPENMVIIPASIQSFSAATKNR